MDDQGHGEWKKFESGGVTDGKGGTVTLPLGSPVSARFVRVLMTESSEHLRHSWLERSPQLPGLCHPGALPGDRRDGQGNFKDLLHHSPDQKQSLTYCSSVDPWHEPSDLYVAPDRMESGDQPGLDLFYTSGITRGLPAVIPVAMLYGTPEDSVAQMTYLKKRGYPVWYVEMGEEPDGQYMQPEDYGAFYLQWATALHRVDPTLKLGGPVFEGVTEDIKVWPDAQGKTSWFGRFLDYLKAHGRLADLAFMSFEHYPYDGCETPWKNLYQEPQLLTHIMQVWRDDGLPPEVPMLDTETNAHGGEASVEIFGALWLSDTFAGFLNAGGKGTFYYHALVILASRTRCARTVGEPTTCSWWTRTMKSSLALRSSLRRNFSPRSGPNRVDAEHRTFAAASDIKDAEGNVLVTAYAVLRPDGQWSLMLINKDYDHPHAVRITFHDGDANLNAFFAGPVAMITFGKAQYQWHPGRKQGYADPDGPAVSATVNGTDGTQYDLPPASITVLRGRLQTNTRPRVN